MPPTRVSTFETEPVFSKAPSDSLSEPEPRSMLSLVVSTVPSGTVSAFEPPTMLSTFEIVTDVGRRAERHLIGAVAEIDQALRDLSREGDDVGAGAANERLDVRDRAGVGRVGERQLVVTGAEIEAARRMSAAPSVTVSACAPPTSDSTLETVRTLAKLPSVSLSDPEPRSIVIFEAMSPSVMVSLPEPPRMLSTLDTVAVLAEPSVKLVVAGAEIDRALRDLGGEGDCIGSRCRR